MLVIIQFKSSSPLSLYQIRLLLLIWMARDPLDMQGSNRPGSQKDNAQESASFKNIFRMM